MVVNMIQQAAGNRDACLSSNQRLDAHSNREYCARRQLAPNDTLRELSLEEIDQLLDRATSPEEKQVLPKQKQRTQNKMNAWVLTHLAPRSENANTSHRRKFR
jgi:hypothetical protein